MQTTTAPASRTVIAAAGIIGDDAVAAIAPDGISSASADELWQIVKAAGVIGTPASTGDGDLASWDADGATPNVRVGRASRVHAVIAGRAHAHRTLLPACGVSAGTSAPRTPTVATVTCPSCLSL